MYKLHTFYAVFINHFFAILGKWKKHKIKTINSVVVFFQKKSLEFFLYKITKTTSLFSKI